MNVLRMDIKKIAECNSIELQKHIGELFDEAWEVLRICSSVVDKCLNTDTISNCMNKTSLAIIIRNILSDCCCCLDASERGHERTVDNNIRMIIEDLSGAIHASEDEKILELICKGSHQFSNSISFAKKYYAGFGKLYGILSKISHHMSTELIVRQWVNRDGLLSHLKPFNPKCIQPHLNVLLIVVMISKIAGEVVEKICLQELSNPYFWSNLKVRKEDVEVDILIDQLAYKIKRLM